MRKALIIRWLLLAACPFAFVSCADPQPKADNQDQVSSIPWNRPEKWEGQGMMGLGTQ